MSDHAIQRWWITYEPVYGQSPEAVPPDAPPQPGQEHWCKSEDVEQLERLVADYLVTIAKLRADLRKFRAREKLMITDNEAMSASIMRLKERIQFLEDAAHKLDEELRTSRERYAILERQKQLIESRYDTLMQRR